MVDFIEPEPPRAPLAAEPGMVARLRRSIPPFVGRSLPVRWHLWTVGGLSLLWSGIGVLDYTMSQLRNRDYLASTASAMNVPVEEMVAFIDSFPAWTQVFWALGVWGALLGSVLLLARQRLAVSSFAASLLGLAVTQIYQAAMTKPEWAETSFPMVLMIWAIAIFLLIYSVIMRHKAVLR